MRAAASAVLRESVPLPVDDDLRAARYDSIINALGAGLSQVQAVEMNGVSSKTVQRLMKQPWARSAVAAMRRERVFEVAGALLQSTEVAIAALVDVAETGPPRARVEAARQLLTLSRQHDRDIVEQELEARIDALEVALSPVEGTVAE